MVKNGTVTIENAKYDTIEIPRDIDAKSVTLKNVTAGALEVQSGADYVVTLSGSDVDALAVTNPEVPGISQKTLLQMIKDKKAITEEVLLAYRAYTEQAAKVANLQPVINATGTNVDKVTVSGSAKLSVTGCDVLVDAKGANAALNVELAGFAGSVDVAVESVDNGYSIANLTLTNSNVAKVNVSGKDGSCKITGNSDVDNVVVSGKNTVTVDVDAKEVSVDKNTTDAKVRIYGAVDTVNVAGKENDIVLASAAAVKTANVTGSDIRVYGYGKLENAEITGTGANVAVAGTAVNGENDFTTPEVMKEMNPLKEIIRHKQDISSTPSDDEEEEEDTPTTPPAGGEENTLDLTGATECDTNSWQVHHFTDKDLRDYAGKTVNFSVDLAMVSEEDSIEVYTQINCDPWTCVADNAVITGEWKTFSYSYVVPAEFADSTSAINLGYRWISSPNDDYADYKFYYKNYTFSVEGEGEGGEVVTPPVDEPAYTGTFSATDEGWWTQNSVTKETILGSVSADDVDYIEFSCPVNIVVQYNQIGNADGAIQTTAATLVELDDINFSGFYMDLILNGNSGVEQTITWKVYTK